MTAALDFCFGALAPLADELVCAKLAEIDGIFTGDLAQPPLVGEARASWLNDYARATGADLSQRLAMLLAQSSSPPPASP